MKRLIIVLMLVFSLVFSFNVIDSEAATFDLKIQNVYDNTYRVVFYNGTSRPIVICRITLNFYNGNKWVTTRVATFTSISPYNRGTAVIHLDGYNWNKYRWEIKSIR